MANIYFDEDVLKNFSESSYNPLHNRLFGRAIRDTGKTGLQTVNFYSTKVSGQPLSMVNSNSKSGIIRGDIVGNKIIFNNLRNVYREDEDAYSAMIEQGTWADHKREIDYQALKHFYEQESGWLFGGEVIKNESSQTMDNPLSMFAPTQLGVQHLSDATPTSFATFIKAVAELVDAVEGSNEEVTEIAMSTILYRKMVEVTNTAGTKSAIDFLKEQYPSVNFIALLDFNSTSKVLAYNATSDKYEAVRGMSPFITETGLTTSNDDGVREYRTVYKMTIGNNNFSKDAIFAERKVIVT